MKSTTPSLTIEVHKDLLQRSAAVTSQATAVRILRQSAASPSMPSNATKNRRARSIVYAPTATGVSKRKAPPPSTLMDSLPKELSSATLLSIEALKDMSTRRADESKDIAARILAQGKMDKQGLGNDRFPCPAKKMGPAHNRITAFILIPLESPHGMPLLCSNAICRKGRLKFVYCHYCKQPVSRMKFDERHAHPEQLLLALADTSATARAMMPKETSATTAEDSNRTLCEAHTSANDTMFDPFADDRSIL